MKPLMRSIRDSMEAATSTYEADLEGSPAEEYLKGRGIDLATAKDFRLGYVEKVLPGYEHVVGRLSIPNICAAERVVGIKFRTITHEEPKYMKRSGDENRLWNLRALNDPNDIMFLCEGELDALTLSILGVSAIAVQGATSFKEYHWRLLEDYRKVVNIRDLDKDGSELAFKLTATDLPVIIVEPPGGSHDVNQAWQDGRGDELLDLIEEVSK